MKKQSKVEFNFWIIVSGILTLIIVLMLIAGFRDKLKLPSPSSSQNNPWDFNNAQHLTGAIYIGSKPFQLVYLCDSSRTIGRFVLKSSLETFYPSVVLREEDCYFGDFDTVTFSRETQNSKFIISSHIGDTTQKLLIEVDPKTYQLVNYEILDFGDRYYKYNQVINWLDDTYILVKTTETDPKTLKSTETYWKAPYNDLTEKTFISL